MKKINLKQLNFQKMGGIIPAIIQDAKSRAVLMLGFMNEETVKKTINNKKVTFWSRTKKRPWEKGETSGNTLEMVSVSSDCDKDCLLIMVNPKGPVCHTGKYSCFGIKKRYQLEFLQGLYNLIIERKEKLPKNSYTAFLFQQGMIKILEKVKEESSELIFAARNETKNRVIEESADLFYHLLVLLAEKRISLSDLIKELKRRRKKRPRY